MLFVSIEGIAMCDFDSSVLAAAKFMSVRGKDRNERRDGRNDRRKDGRKEGRAAPTCKR